MNARVAVEFTAINNSKITLEYSLFVIVIDIVKIFDIVEMFLHQNIQFDYFENLRDNPIIFHHVFLI